MKRVLWFVFLLLSIDVLFATKVAPEPKLPDESIHWVSLEEAEHLLKSEAKDVLLFFYTDWCDYCNRMEASTLQDPGIIEMINTHFYPVRFNVERTDDVVFRGRIYRNLQAGKEKPRHQLALSLAVIDRTIGYPTIVFFDHDLQQVMPPTRGFKSAEKLLRYLDFVVGDAYRSMDISEYFTDGNDDSC